MRVHVLAGVILCVLVIVQESDGANVRKKDNSCVSSGGVCKRSCRAPLPEGECPGQQVCCNQRRRLAKGGLKLTSKDSDGGKRMCKKTYKKCRNQGGKCVEAGTCATQTLEGGCRGSSCECCLAEDCSTKIKKKCENYDGACKASCAAGERIIEKGCKGNKCKCCAEACKPTNKCEGGFCVEKAKDCSGKLLKSGCEGKKCFCCLPSPCVPKKKCKGGFCVSKKKECKGGQFLKKGCKGKNCACCIPKCVKKKICNGGFCVSNKQDCKGVILSNGCKSKPKGGECYCCIEGKLWCHVGFNVRA
ncbi:keratin, ultra high-sulfur matrix protein-like [Penaeus chinensis]|uniref:keratin, ultra high-sulfur matrix protein-like n=1 Tax=Penaeus chinensis TaxID=139456 RepID=UPI001FB6D2B8|nr:keratin, ultra high-sulfur matrix protein-like [Penaeus chinensis]